MREPDTNVMRATYATAATYRQSPDPGRATEFDRWLAGIKADAWDEGHDAATDEAPDGVWPDAWIDAPNPYEEAAWKAPSNTRHG